MASLWNFVARFTSRRRQEPQQRLQAPDDEQQDDASLLGANAVSDDGAAVSDLPQAGLIAGRRRKRSPQSTSRWDPGRHRLRILLLLPCRFTTMLSLQSEGEARTRPMNQSPDASLRTLSP